MLTVGGLDTNCYIVSDDAGNTAVIDPGDDFEKIDRILSEEKTKVKTILLTHGHYDHTGAVNQIKEKYGCEIVISALDEELLSDDSKNAAEAMETTTKPIIADRLVEDADEIKVGELTFCVIATPGHTKGGVTYRLGNTLFTGDTLFRGTVGRYDLYGGNPIKLAHSLKRLMKLDGDYDVLPGHGMKTTLRYEESTNRYIRTKK